MIEVISHIISFATYMNSRFLDPINNHEHGQEKLQTNQVEACLHGAKIMQKINRKERSRKFM